MTRRSSWWIAVPLLAACGGETSGELVRIEVALQSAPLEGETLDEHATDTRYAVELDAASVRIGSIFAFGAEPGARAEPSPLERVREALVSTAYAHGGVDLVSGRTVHAEWLEPVTLDLLEDGPVVLGEVEAEAGAVDAFTIELARPGRGGPQLRLSGRATRDETRLELEGALELGDDVLERRIELTGQDVRLTEGGRLTILVHASVWLQNAELDRAPTDDDGLTTLTPESQPGRAWAIGARSPAAFSIEWRP